MLKKVFLCKMPSLPLGRKKRLLIRKFYLPDKKVYFLSKQCSGAPIHWEGIFPNQGLLTLLVPDESINSLTVLLFGTIFI